MVATSLGAKVGVVAVVVVLVVLVLAAVTRPTRRYQRQNCGWLRNLAAVLLELVTVALGEMVALRKVAAVEMVAP